MSADIGLLSIAQAEGLSIENPNIYSCTSVKPACLSDTVYEIEEVSMKQNTFQAIGMVFMLLALVGALLFFVTGVWHRYQWVFIVFMTLAVIFYLLNALQKVRK